MNWDLQRRPRSSSWAYSAQQRASLLQSELVSRLSREERARVSSVIAKGKVFRGKEDCRLPCLRRCFHSHPAFPGQSSEIPSEETTSQENGRRGRRGRRRR